MATKTKTIVLAYSGGLDTSVAIKWLADHYHAEIITVTADLGNNPDLPTVKKRALATGAIKAHIVDGKSVFIDDFIWPALKASALYEGVYPLATALARPLIAKFLVEVAKQENAFAVAHGCTGKGNDQVRFDVSTLALAPELQILAPARIWNMNRDQEIDYARENNIPITIGPKTPYSVDENLWGRSIEAGSLENPDVAPTKEVFEWTRSIDKAPSKGTEVKIDFAKGIPVGINNKRMDGLTLIEQLNEVAGLHGIGRIDHIENRLVGIKSREIYEAPAATVLHIAHNALEYLTLTKEQRDLKSIVSQEYSRMVYNGLWFSTHRQNLEAYVNSTQEYVSGSVRLKLHKGNCIIRGRTSPYSLYKFDLASYGLEDTFDHIASEGFIKIYGMPIKTQAEILRNAN